MGKPLTAVFPQGVLIFSLILSLVVAGDIQTAKTEGLPTVEGEWVVTSTNDFNTYNGDKIVVVREGNGYDIIDKPKNPSLPKNYINTGLYYGTPKEITVAVALSYNDLAHMYKGTGLSVSTLMEWAGKITKRYRFKISGDGNSAEYANDKPRLSRNPRTGRIIGYEIIPYAYKTNLVRVSPAAQTKKIVTSAVAQVESRGEFYVLTRDGRKLTGKDASQIPLEEGTKVITGSSGHIRMKLPDDTTFTIGPNSDIAIDSFVYDPDNTPKKVIANMSKGVFRWVTGKTKPLKDPAEMKVKLPVMAVGIRGTDLEATVNPDGSGSVVLHFGQLEITENKTGFTFIMNAGYKVTFKADGTVSRPIKVD